MQRLSEPGNIVEEVKVDKVAAHRLADNISAGPSSNQATPVKEEPQLGEKRYREEVLLSTANVVLPQLFKRPCHSASDTTYPRRATEGC
jgi:hypothetical protein